MVWDLAAKSQGQLLNDGLQKGPSLQNNLPIFLMNFGKGSIGVQGDTSKMFNEVKFARNFSSFLLAGVIIQVAKTAILTRAGFSQYCWHFMAQEYSEDNGQGVSAIRFNCHMDDILGAKEDEIQASRCFEEI